MSYYNTHGQYVSGKYMNKTTIQTRLTNTNQNQKNSCIENFCIDNFINIPFFPSLVENKNSLSPFDISPPKTLSFTNSNEPNNMKIIGSNIDNNCVTSPIQKNDNIKLIKELNKSYIKKIDNIRPINELEIPHNNINNIDSSLSINQTIFNRRKFSKASMNQVYYPSPNQFNNS